ncbi:(3R)-3-hydroxyacyl-CoA dehydrogenase-like [Dermacentor andersoni]|uniref:(3R)-3-hydroxyacyl-CoA dehydrogenase-like n=1 Tax=Dermacentor andersoni TaxID=34620 RepID=UPI002416ECA7|nr:(3R)-3-hydroxyacyl-CoA dehydrogenase-like [Dermacentor andersoni]
MNICDLLGNDVNFPDQPVSRGYGLSCSWGLCIDRGREVQGGVFPAHCGYREEAPRGTPPRPRTLGHYDFRSHVFQWTPGFGDGGASGIGEAVCRALAAEGATVVIVDRQLEGASRVAESLQGEAEHHAMYADVGNSSSVEHLFADIRSKFSQPPSIVVNCVGICLSTPLPDCGDELFDELIRVNLRGTFLVNRGASRDMLRSGIYTTPDGGGAIVNVASIMANCGWYHNSAYAASKAGVVAITKSAGQELAAHVTRCNAVLLGTTDAPMSASAGESLLAMAVDRIPLKWIAQLWEIAQAVKFLCSSTASSFVTGTTLEVTGGFASWSCHIERVLR